MDQARPHCAIPKIPDGQRPSSDDRIEAIESEVQAEIKAAEERWAQAVEKPIDPLEMFDHAYAEMPSHLLAQREELRQVLTDQTQTGQNGE